MKYILSNITKSKTSTGIDKAMADIEGVDGHQVAGVTLWKSSWEAMWDKLDGTLEVEGEYVEKQNGQWLNKNLYPPKEEKPAGKFGGGVAKAQETKAAMIKVAQENKDESIKISSTARDAVLCAIAEYEKDKTNLSTLEELIEKWRKYLWMNWEKTNTDYPPFK